jgi:hypothetical protein
MRRRRVAEALHGLRGMGRGHLDKTAGAITALTENGMTPA